MISREECLELLNKYNVEKMKIKHILLVEKVAVFLAKKLIEKGEEVDIERLSRAALLHDLIRGKHHAQEGYEICLKKGIDEKICLLIKKHGLETILDSLDTWEEKILFYADKICKYEVIGIDERFRPWIEKAGQIDLVEKKKQKTEELEKEILDKAGIKFEDIKNEC